MSTNDTTPLRQQYLELKAKYPDTILFFRLGDFYETFDSDAELVSRELDLTLTSRPISRDARVPMAGVPHHAVEGYIARLIERGYRVAIAEQVGEPTGQGPMERRVERVVTAGTVIEPAMLDEKRPNYLAAVVIDGERAGVAYADISTGEFATTQLADSNGRDIVGAVRQELARLHVREVLIPKAGSWRERDGEERAVGPEEALARLLAIQVTSWPGYRFEETTARQGRLVRAINQVFREAIGCDTTAQLGTVALAVAEEITGSRFGLIGEIGSDGLLRDVAISNPGWDQCAKLDPSGHRRLLDLPVRGLYGQVLTEGRSLVTNHPAAHPASRGVPNGHPPLKAFLGVPLIQEGRTVGIVAVANRPGGYDAEQREVLEALAPAILQALQRKHAEQALRESEADLRNLAEQLTKARDELEQRVRERTLELADTVMELRRSNADLQQFAYAASHDLQEPLRMVASFVQLLQMRYEGKLDDRADEFIHHAVEGAMRMSCLLRGLLEYSRVETRGRIPVPTDCRQILDHVLKDLYLTIEESGAQVTTDPLPTVPADRTQLAQVFQNLISNAIKFRAESRPPQIRVSARRDGGEWVFSVADNGIGIEPQYFDQIFVVFKRLQHDRRRYPGTGIGLAMVKRIVERHSGRVWVDSRHGQGATFHFALPAE